jgi:hypothetical protein
MDIIKTTTEEIKVFIDLNQYGQILDIRPLDRNLYDEDGTFVFNSDECSEIYLAFISCSKSAKTSERNSKTEKNIVKEFITYFHEGYKHFIHEIVRQTKNTDDLEKEGDEKETGSILSINANIKFKIVGCVVNFSIVPEKSVNKHDIFMSYRTAIDDKLQNYRYKKKYIEDVELIDLLDLKCRLTIDTEWSLPICLFLKYFNNVSGYDVNIKELISKWEKCPEYTESSLNKEVSKRENKHEGNKPLSEAPTPSRFPKPKGLKIKIPKIESSDLKKLDDSINSPVRKKSRTESMDFMDELFGEDFHNELPGDPTNNFSEKKDFRTIVPPPRPYRSQSAHGSIGYAAKWGELLKGEISDDKLKSKCFYYKKPHTAPAAAGRKKFIYKSDSDSDSDLKIGEVMDFSENTCSQDTELYYSPRTEYPRPRILSDTTISAPSTPRKDLSYITHGYIPKKTLRFNDKINK